MKTEEPTNLQHDIDLAFRSLDGHVDRMDGLSVLVADLRTEVDQLQEVANDIPGASLMLDGGPTTIGTTLVVHDATLRGLIERVESLETPSSLGISATEPFVERYARVNITKGAKGDYRHETTVSVTMAGGTWGDLKRELDDGLRIADRSARNEIQDRIGWDQHPDDSDDTNEPAF